MKAFIRLLCVVLLTSVCACGTESDWEKLEKVTTALKEEVQKSSPDEQVIESLKKEQERLFEIPEVKERVEKQMGLFLERHMLVLAVLMNGCTEEVREDEYLALFMAAVIGEREDGDNPAYGELRTFLVSKGFFQEKDNKNGFRESDLDSEELKKNAEDTAEMVSDVAAETAQLVSDTAEAVSDLALGRSKNEKSQAMSTVVRKNEDTAPEKTSAKSKNSVSEIVLTLPGGAKIEFMRIPAGTFIMGSPEYEGGRGSDENQVRVNISNAFYMGKTEVTEAQYSAVMNDDAPSNNGENEPVTKVCWGDAMSFCKQLTAWAHSQGKMLGWKFTLPTEAQWEYACRAGTTTIYYSGDKIRDLKRVACYSDTSGWGPDPVGKKEPNAWGLYDMHGNVWEWCLDWYDSRLSGGNDPVGPLSGSSRVNRGGSWFNPVSGCRAAERDYDSPSTRLFSLGFRVALVQE